MRHPQSRSNRLDRSSEESERGSERPAIAVGALDRVRLSPLLNRLLPTSATMTLARCWAIGRWHTSISARLEALMWASTFLDEDPAAPAVSSLAKRAHVERAARTALAVRPWKVRHAKVEGLEHLASTRAGRGAILMFAHIGDYRSVLLALAGNGVRYHVSRWPMHDVQSFARLLRWRQIRWLAEAGVRFVYAGGSYKALRTELERGGTCAIAFDVPGGTDTPFLGKRVGMASGIASLAREAEVPVIPAFPARGRRAEIGRLGAPVDPMSFATVDELQAYLAEIVSAVIMENPELTYPPHAAVGQTLQRTPYAQRLETRLAGEKRRREKAEHRAAEAQAKSEAVLARVRAIETSTWWRVGTVLSSRIGMAGRQEESKREG